MMASTAVSGSVDSKPLGMAVMGEVVVDMQRAETVDARLAEAL